ncbi:hypothetical protein BDV98DRAFT_568731 [Pterulicium gracile]|uniref:Uncharacterized protein n=1 Tax=Pterulicium gracile TaxID=1884261 RepID=A0A5C3QFF0_9AGAR|nr:hypothetical protein BDV98DRAFT_568731 [Pterula gracilis]
MRLSLVSLALSATASALQVSFSTPSTRPAGLIFETFSWWNKPPIPKFNTHFFEDAIKLGWQKAHDGAVEQFELAKRLAEENKINFNITPLVEKAKMLIDATRELREQIFLLHPDEEVAAMLDGVDLDGFSEEFGKLLEDVQRSLEAQFPHPDGAPSHEERSGRVRAALSQAKESFVRLSVAHGIEEEKARESFGKIEPLVHDLVVLAGDLAEQHPKLLEAILIGGIMLIIPENLLLRPIFGLLGWGPYGPVKGSFAAWAQRFFFGAEVEEGSWFAALQRWTMNEVPWYKWVYGWARDTLKAIFG